MKKVFGKFLFILLIAMAALGFVVFQFVKVERPRMSFQKNLKQRTSAAELHEWAMSVLAPFQTSTDPALWIKVTNLRPALHGLDKWPPSAYIYADSLETPEPVPYLKITYGSAAGHFGVLIAPTNFPSPASRENVVRYVTWSPGLWFFDGK